ncbi:minor capsid protein [Carnobacterium jeotgali]|uniref:minor capsid protein n=1 Tax=Carnobacterium jeotgali TaxID=545534 RepID=UPI00389068FF
MAKEAYWIKRERDHINKSIKDDKIIIKKLQENYDRALNEITKEIDAFYGKYAAKEGISMNDAIKKVKLSDTKAFASKAKKYVKEKDFSPKANTELRLYNLTMKVNRLEMLKADIGLELVAMSNDEEKIMRSALEKNVYDEFERQAGILGETVLDNQKTIKDIVNASFQNATFDQRIWSNQDALKAELDKLLSRGMIQGKNPRALAREIKKTFGVSTRQSERLMVTELARTQTAAQERSFKEYGFEQYVYIPEPTACSICLPLNGKVFNVKDMMPGVNASPMHPFVSAQQQLM